MASKRNVIVTREPGGTVHIRQPSALSTRLFGLPFLLFGLYISGIWVIGLVSIFLPEGVGLKTGSILGFVLTPFFALIFLAPGVFLTLHSWGTRLNPGEGTLTSYDSFVVWKRTRTHALSSFTGVELSSDLVTTRSRTGRGATPFHSVDLVTDQGEEVGVCGVFDEKQAKEIADLLTSYIDVAVEDRLGEIDADPED